MHYGFLEVKARSFLGPHNLAALWLIGYEEKPENSGEITVFEIFGNDLQLNADGINMATIGQGIKKIHDPNLQDEFNRTTIFTDDGKWHIYAIDWRADGIRFYIDGQLTASSTQSPHYPMQLMLNFYELSTPLTTSKAQQPSCLEVDYIRCWER